MAYELSLQDFTAKIIYPLGEDFRGKSKDREELSFTNYYMEKSGTPFFGISGEFHYSRMSDAMWEDELIKMKMCGINVVSTYIFWIHHEEEEGVFDFSGCKDLHRFVALCRKHGLYVILRVGPFDHGEVRNGGIPDWMYGMPFEVRKLSEGFLYYTRRLYTRIAREVEGLFFLRMAARLSGYRLIMNICIPPHPGRTRLAPRRSGCLKAMKVRNICSA